MKPLFSFTLALGLLSAVATPAFATLESDLASASGNGDLTMVKALVQNGANLNVRDEEGYTPLMWASQHGYANVATYLCEHGANLNPLDAGGYTPLMWAVQEGHYDVATTLLAHGANVNAHGAYGRTALDLTNYTRDGRIRDVLYAYATGKQHPTAMHPIASAAGGNGLAGTPAMAIPGLPAANPGQLTAQPASYSAGAPGQEPDALTKATVLARLADSARRAGVDLDAYAHSATGSLSLNSLSDPDLPLSRDLGSMYNNVAQSQNLVNCRQDWAKANADWGNRATSRFGSYVVEVDNILKSASL